MTNTGDVQVGIGEEGLSAQYDLVAPRADALMESLRATGYSLPDAVSDLIDNSITAGARNVRLHFQWAGVDSCVKGGAKVSRAGG